MQTKLYIQDLKNIIDGETYSSKYSFFLIMRKLRENLKMI